MRGGNRTPHVATRKAGGATTTRLILPSTSTTLPGFSPVARRRRQASESRAGAGRTHSKAGCAARTPTEHPRLSAVFGLPSTALYVPFPAKFTRCVPPKALSWMATYPKRNPTAVGVNVTSIVHLAPGLRLLPQVLVWAKSPGLTPSIVIE